MFGEKWKQAVAGVAVAGVACAAMAQQVHTNNAYKPAAQQATKHAGNHAAMHHTSLQHNAAGQKETLTFEIRGVNSAADAKLLSSALASHECAAPLQASGGKPLRTTVTIDRQADLGAAGQAVMAAQTPDKAQSPPSLDLVVFGKFDKASAQKAAEALGKIKGIDAKDSNTNVSAGELNIRVQGGAKVTADQIHRALQEAGIWTQFTPHNSARRS